ncbi:MAG TPA: hypothetical protein VMU33_09815 [Burkholderiaceae bacterium]|nr:hypothetical protein [Burkholderiaceae bacterium]
MHMQRQDPSLLATAPTRRRGSMRSTLKRLGAGGSAVAILDREHRLVGLNASAAALLAEANCLALAEGRVIGFSGSASMDFDAAVQTGLAGHPCNVTVSVDAGRHAGTWVVGFFGSATPHPERRRSGVVALQLHRPPALRLAADFIGRLFGLTVLETAALEWLADGRRPEPRAGVAGAATPLNAELLQRLLQKTASSHVEDLVELTLAAAGLAEHETAATGEPPDYEDGARVLSAPAGATRQPFPVSRS